MTDQKKEFHSPRIAAVHAIHEVLNGKSLAESLPEAQASLSDPRDKAFTQALSYGVCRWFWQLAAIVDELLQKPFKSKDEDVYILLLVGLYQLTAMRVPPHAAIYETVACVEELEKEWARGLVNGVLRSYQRKADELQKYVTDDIEARYSHPEWLIEKIKHDWPQHWEAILEANNQQPPLTLRVNQQHNTREAYLAKLAEIELVAQPLAETQYGLILEKPVDVSELPGFSAGEASVQDGGAQLAAELLDLQEDARILDACAAPGGKAMHILEKMPGISLTAVEKDKLRMMHVRENLRRLNFKAACVHANAGYPETWWDGQQFDHVLLDSPCTGSGVIRRHPDIKLLRQPHDVAAAAKEQRHLIRTLWPMVKPGGTLLYVTCSIFLEENVDIIKEFLSTHADAKEQKITKEWGLECEVGRQVLPGMHNMDGFYYAHLVKTSI